MFELLFLARFMNSQMMLQDFFIPISKENGKKDNGPCGGRGERRFRLSVPNKVGRIGPSRSARAWIRFYGNGVLWGGV